MKAFWKSRPVKTVGILAALLVLGMLIAAATGHGETAQSGVLGTVFAPAHWAAEKISDGLATLSGNAKGNTEYEKKIDELQRQLGEMQEQLADYKNIKSQNEEYKEALELKKLCAAYHVPFVINDNVEIAAKMDADGVHVGQSDMEAGDVRAKLGPDKIIGVSAQTVEQAILAEQRGADYLGVGAVFHTGSKADAEDVSHETLTAICNAVNIPVIAIGGITRDNVTELSGSGICGIAVISAIFAQKDIVSATKDLKEQTLRMLENK